MPWKLAGFLFKCCPPFEGPSTSHFEQDRMEAFLNRLIKVGKTEDPKKFWEDSWLLFREILKNEGCEERGHLDGTQFDIPKGIVEHGMQDLKDNGLATPDEIANATAGLLGIVEEKGGDGTFELLDFAKLMSDVLFAYLRVVDEPAAGGDMEM